MVNHTAIHSEAEIFDDECPDTVYANNTEHQQDGEFDWSTSKQGWILSSFFYGYVLTQVNFIYMIYNVILIKLRHMRGARFPRSAKVNRIF